MQYQKPIFTLTLLALLAGVHFLPVDKEVLYFSAEAVWQGQVWRLLTGNLVHADLNHLAWNCLGLGILGAMIERYSTSAWWVAMLSGMLFVDLLLLSPFSTLNYYCGLSGVLHSLLVFLLWLEWRLQPSWQVPVVGVLVITKTIVEIYSGNALFSDTSWPPYAWSHVAGLLGGAIFLGFQGKKLNRSILCNDEDAYEMTGNRKFI